MTAFRWMGMCAAAAVCLGLATGPGLAQTPAAPGGQDDMMKMMYQAAHNQLGVLQYCQAQGSVGQDVVDIQKRVMAMLPPAKVDGLDAAEAAGRKGIVQAGGSSEDIKEAAAAQGSTPDALCKQMGEMMKMQASQLPK